MSLFTLIIKESFSRDVIVDPSSVRKKACPECKGDLRVGDIIDNGRDANALYIVPLAPLNNDTLRITKCWKCVNCGHSERFERLGHHWEPSNFNVEKEWCVRCGCPGESPSATKPCDPMSHPHKEMLKTEK